MGLRHRGRQIALQVLYQKEVGGISLEEALLNYEKHLNPSPEAFRFARELTEGVIRHLEKIDEVIQRYSEHWRLERMSVTDRNILRLATYELLFRPDIPPKVSINEAVELAKEFGTEDSPAFVNGILDAIYHHEVKGGL
ncbi:transcription antitermination factor NusB [Thermosulfurimonas dismutans]|uniref:Transcription antitermination protein NusB n=1 Tax=Thermosulfurimonas dismutans TaxID=999894 RepID=A0A179D3I3_9BACT|nr:transcription antitermination factor NusB [Thermosulfurimonas dismutans]OAQ20188.1 Transcription termination protein NusB [Thermosulfurimonas dismutans]